MTYDIYRLIFEIAAIAAGIMLVTAVLLFILLRIPAVIGDLTGSTARKAIEDIRSQNEETGRKTYGPSPVNRARGKITSKMTPSGRIERARTDDMNGAMNTAELPAGAPMVAAAGASDETVVLDTGYASPETEVLDTPVYASDETAVLGGGSDETVVLNAAPYAAAETTVLSAQTAPQNWQISNTPFTIEYEITFIHTNEIIA